MKVTPPDKIIRIGNLTIYEGQDPVEIEDIPCPICEYKMALGKIHHPRETSLKYSCKDCGLIIEDKKYGTGVVQAIEFHRYVKKLMEKKNVAV